MAALDRMGAYLRGLQTFRVRSDAVGEVVTGGDQKIQVLATTSYLIAGPDRMAVDIGAARSHRQIFYDGNVMSLVAPERKKYVRFPVSGSVAAVLGRAADDYGIDFPLRDLVLWGKDGKTPVTPTAASVIGAERIGTADVTHYAYRAPGHDFQVWLQDGDKPLPLRMVITSTDQPAQPQYAANFTWDLAPAVAADAFRFAPPADFALVDFGTARLAAAQ